MKYGCFDMVMMLSVDIFPVYRFVGRKFIRIFATSKQNMRTMNITERFLNYVKKYNFGWDFCGFLQIFIVSSVASVHEFFRVLRV